VTDPNSVGYETLGADINKRPTDGSEETKQGVVSEKLPELSLEMTNVELEKLIKKWEKAWDESPKKQAWEKLCEENKKYWMGDQFDSFKNIKTRPNVDNLIFESLETYLPQVTRRNPEPIVELVNGEDETLPKNVEYLKKLKIKLGVIADKNKLRLKLKRGARNWAMNMVGIAKFGWDLDKNIPAVRIIRPQKIKLDPDAWTDEDGYTGNRIGELRKMEASKLLSIIGPEDETNKEGIAKLNELTKEDKATEIQFTEWWTNEYMCWVLDGKVLLKKKNPHWNYDQTIEPPADLNAPNALTSSATSVDEYGNVTGAPQEKKGINHFDTPQMPFRFLVMFTLGDQPMDNTSLMTQNLANQDRINKRNKQIDKNADTMNDGMVVSLERSGLTESQAKSVSNALRKGGVVAIPSGSPQEAIYRPTVNSLPADVFNDRNDTRERMRDIFGTRGSSAAGLQNEDTVRGKIISRGLDTDRIGGGISEYLEQFADDIYNYFAQLLYVYDDAFTFIAGTEPPKVNISVKEGSLLPKDSTTIANQAIELATAGKMSNLDLYKRLEYPNPEELAANVWLETNAPQILYANDPRIAQVVEMQAQAAKEAAADKTTDEMIGKSIDHAHNMEREKVKSESKGGKTPPTDPISEVPQN